MPFWPGSEDRGDPALVGSSGPAEGITHTAAWRWAGARWAHGSEWRPVWPQPEGQWWTRVKASPDGSSPPPAHCPFLGAKLRAPHMSVGGRVGAQRASRGQQGRAGALLGLRLRLSSVSRCLSKPPTAAQTGSPCPGRTLGAWSEPRLASGLTPDGRAPIFATPLGLPTFPGRSSLCLVSCGVCLGSVCHGGGPAPLLQLLVGGPGVRGRSSCLKQAAEDDR